MEDLKGATVKTQDGMTGRIVALSQPSDGGGPQALISLDNGRQVFVPADLLDRRSDGNYYLPMDLSSIEKMEATRGKNIMVVPMMTESMKVNQRPVSTGGVRITKNVNTREESIQDKGYEEEVDINRVPVNKIIQKPAKTRFEGKTMIIPVMEEVLVVEKRLMLKEEVHVTKYRKPIPAPSKVHLRQEEVNVERLQPDTEEPGREKQPQNTNMNS